MCNLIVVVVLGVVLGDTYPVIVTAENGSSQAFVAFRAVVGGGECAVEK